MDLAAAYFVTHEPTSPTQYSGNRSFLSETLGHLHLMATSLIAVWSLLLYDFIVLSASLTTVSSISLQSLNDSLRPSTIVQNNTLPPLRISTLTAPIPPPDFGMEIAFTEETLLPPQEMYTNAIEVMGFFASEPYDADLRFSQARMGNPRFSSEISFITIQPILQYKHVVAALYQVGLIIATENRFYTCHVLLVVREEAAGLMNFQRRPSGVHDEGPVSNMTDFVTLTDGTPALSNNTVVADSGTRVDPTDSRFKIAYEYDGVRIKAADTFTAFLDGLAIAAERHGNEVDAFVNAVSASGDCAINIHAWFGQQLSWERLRRALLVIWETLIVGDRYCKGRYEGLDFELVYNGVKIGEGFLLRLSGVSGGSEGTAVVR